MPKISPQDELNFGDLPVIRGPTLAPRKYGPEHCWKAICAALEVLPNLAECKARRLRERRPAPVPFVWRD